jgi:hypothetical protein
MPEEACQFFYDCKGCGERLKPKPGGLLRILFVRLSAVSANPGRTVVECLVRGQTRSLR